MYKRQGEVRYGPAEDSFKDFLTLLNGWYKDGLLDVNIANVDAKTLETYILNDRLGATLGSASGELGKWMRAKEGTEFELVGAPYPVLNEGERPRLSTREWEYNPSSSYATVSYTHLKVVQREERMGVIKAFLVFSVASFDLAVVAGGVRTNQLVPDSQLGSGCFEQGWQITLSG